MVSAAPSRAFLLLVLSGASAMPACAHETAGPGGPPPPEVGAWVTYWDFDRGRQRLAGAPAPLDDVFFFLADLGPDGRPGLARPELPLEAVLGDLRQGGARSWLTIVNDRRAGKGTPKVLKDDALVHRILADPEERAAHRRAIVDLAALHSFSGVDVDYENLRAGDRSAFTTFVRELQGDLEARGLRLSVTVQPKRAESRSDGPGAADWAALCLVADRLQVMLYNLHNTKTGPGPLTAPGWFGEVLAFARGQCDPAKVVPVIKVGAMDWGPDGGSDLQHADVAGLLEAYGATVEREAEGGTPFFRYVSGDGAHTVYYEDAESVLRKVAALRGLGFDRVVLWSLGREDPQLLPRLLARPGPAPAGSPSGPGSGLGSRARTPASFVRSARGPRLPTRFLP